MLSHAHIAFSLSEGSGMLTLFIAQVRRIPESGGGGSSPPIPAAGGGGGGSAALIPLLGLLIIIAVALLLIWVLIALVGKHVLRRELNPAAVAVASVPLSLAAVWGVGQATDLRAAIEVVGGGAFLLGTTIFIVVFLVAALADEEGRGCLLLIVTAVTFLIVQDIAGFWTGVFSAAVVCASLVLVAAAVKAIKRLIW